MYLIQAKHIITCNKNFDILENKAIVFDDTIIDIGNIDELSAKYPKSIVVKNKKNNVILPGLINTHIHLEFSSNTTRLKYGDFSKWLDSVIANTANTISNIKKVTIDKKLKKMLSSGTTSIGAISSFGLDLQSLANSCLNIIYFNEAMAPQSELVNSSFENFENRFKKSTKYKSKTFIPAVAIHSSYSVHPLLLEKLLSFIQNTNTISSCHFLESLDEKRWLDDAKSNFEILLKRKSIFTSKKFLEKLSILKHLLLTHNTYIEKEEYKIIKNNNFFITHCPVSNRYLGSKSANFNYLQNLKSSIGTDGLSSNISLSMFDELRSALLIHNDIEINFLAKHLLLFATKNGADALGINTGEISIGKNADIIISQMPDICSNDDVVLNTILHTKQVQKSFINGILSYGSLL